MLFHAPRTWLIASLSLVAVAACDCDPAEGEGEGEGERHFIFEGEGEGAHEGEGEGDVGSIVTLQFLTISDWHGQVDPLVVRDATTMLDEQVMTGGIVSRTVMV